MFAALAGNSDVDWRAQGVHVLVRAKGVATMTFALFVLGSQVPEAERIANLAALTVLISVIAHGLTDHAGAEWIARRSEPEPEPAVAA